MLKFDIESGPLQSHRYAQCSWHKHSDTMVTFVSYNSDIFDAELTEYGLTFHPHKQLRVIAERQQNKHYGRCMN